MQRTRHRQPTLQQVAALSGVSLATASRALSGRGAVAATTASNVLAAARKLGYTFDDEGEGAIRRVAVVASQISSQFVTEVVQGIQDEAAEATMGCVFVSTGGSPESEVEALRRLLLDAQLAGVVLTGGGRTGVVEESFRGVVEEYRKHRTPLVFCGRPAISDDLPEMVIDYDNLGGARAAASYLFSQGHRDILFLRGPKGFSSSDLRAQGFLAACEEFGIKPNPALVRFGERNKLSGLTLARAAMREGVRFTAVFGECDLLALGAMEAVRSEGLSVPRDVSIIGFDDMTFAEDFPIPLTTVHVPFRDLGRTAARMLLGGPEPNRAAHRLAGTHLVIRESVASNWGASGH
uniref:LacI family DNA-binding transcriptional regulator n=1 Tax=Tessaracoccus timonensis TaxID=2161816 RepID=UPI00131EF691|nr:LacI family DNA-binding transcriptional regulator [Tessaracoccus timonensis]